MIVHCSTGVPAYVLITIRGESETIPCSLHVVYYGNTAQAVDFLVKQAVEIGLTYELFEVRQNCCCCRVVLIVRVYILILNVRFRSYWKWIKSYTANKYDTVNPVFLKVIYFSDLETHQNLKSIVP